MESLWQNEIAITLFFQHLGNWLMMPMKGVSFLGQVYFFIIVMPAIYWCIDSRNGLRLGLMLLSTALLNTILKIAFHHPRPYWVDKRVAAWATEPTFGMPSGHSQNAVAMWGYFAVLYRRKWTILAAIATILLTGISRIYLGVHFADQVIAGWVIGGILLGIFYAAEPAMVRMIARLTITQLIVVIFLISWGFIGLNQLFITTAGSIPPSWQANALAAAPGTPFTPLDPGDMIGLAGIFMGLAVGAVWDWRKHGQPPVGRNLKQKIERYLIGIAGLAGFFLLTKAISQLATGLLEPIVIYSGFAIVGLWITLIAPSLFRRLGLV